MPRSAMDVDGLLEQRVELAVCIGELAHDILGLALAPKRHVRGPFPFNM